MVEVTACNFPCDLYSMAIYQAPISSLFFADNPSSSPEFSGNFSLPFLLCFSSLRSHTTDSILTFEAQNLLKEPEKEVCSFDNADIAAIRASGAFPVDAIIRPFDREVQSDVSSNEWVCFLAYPFSIGLRYRFPALFELTGLSYAQTMPMVWRVLVTLDQIRSSHIPDLCMEDLPIAYCLRSHGKSRFLLFFKPPKIPLSSKPQKMRISGNESSVFFKEIILLRVLTSRLSG
ncbi:hypothetical protein Hanom_Chr02g00115191 [Helianthus anomalus]